MSFLKSIFSKKSTFYKLLVIFVVWIFCMTIASAITIALSQVIHEEITQLKTTQALLQIFGFIAATFICTYLFDQNTKRYLNLSTDVKAVHYLLAVTIIICAIPAINFIAEWNEKIKLPECFHNIELWMQQQEIKNKELTDRFLTTSSWGGFFINLLVMAIIPALAEELFFRGLLQKTFSKRFGVHIGIWLSAILFSGIHLQFYGFFPRMLLGATLGYFVYWSYSIYPAIFAHFINNAIIVASVFFSKSDKISSIGTTNQWAIGLTSCIVCGILLWILQKYRTRVNDVAHEQ